jgi:hypothetical protein
MCFGLLYGDRVQYPDAVKKARIRSNLNLIAVDGAVIGTIERDWHSSEKPEHPMHNLAVSVRDLGSRTTASSAQCKCLLGDFAAFGEFLSQQLAQPLDGAKGASA